MRKVKAGNMQMHLWNKVGVKYNFYLIRPTVCSAHTYFYIFPVTAHYVMRKKEKKKKRYRFISKVLTVVGTEYFPSEKLRSGI